MAAEFALEKLGLKFQDDSLERDYRQYRLTISAGLIRLVHIVALVIVIIAPLGQYFWSDIAGSAVGAELLPYFIALF